MESTEDGAVSVAALEMNSGRACVSLALSRMVRAFGASAHAEREASWSDTDWMASTKAS